MLDLKAVYVALSENVDILNSFVVESIIGSASKTIPSKSNSVRANFRQPYPKNILDIITECDHAKRLVENNRFSENNNIPELRKIFNSLTKKLKIAIAEFDNDNMNNLIKNVGPHPVSSRPFWNKINNFRKPKNPSFGGSIKSGNIILSEPKDKANLFGSILKETYSAEQSCPYFDNLFFNKVNSESELITNSAENDSSWEGEGFQNYSNVTIFELEWFI